MNQTSKKNKIIEMYCLLVADLLMIAASYLLAVIIRFGSLYMTQLHTNICLCFMLVSVMYSLLLDWNAGFIKRGYLVEFVAVLKYNLTMVFLVAGFLFVTSRAGDFSRLIWGYVFLFNTILTFIGHIIIKHFLERYYRSEHCRIRVMVITDTKGISKLVNKLEKSLPITYEITTIAVMREIQNEDRESTIPIIDGRKQLIETAKQMPLDEVFLRFDESDIEQVKEIVRDFESMGIICHYSIDIMEWNAKESSIEKFGDYTVVSYSIYREDYRRHMIKRTIDIVGGVLGMLITVILTPFIAIAIKINSKGPVLFTQVRIGKNGRRFKIYKFRSMYIDAEERKKELESQNEMSGLMFKIKNDPRITPVGKFIRKTSLDELPQFYNVLRGDMSLVGTRPPTESEFEQYSPYYRRRLCMTPGLTGLWQVSGRSEITDFEEVVKFDLEYIDNWSLTLDIKILLKTIWVVFTRKGSD